FGIYNFVSGLNAAGALFAQVPALRTYVALDILLGGGVLAYSFYAGLALWRVRPHAVRTVKRFFAVSLAYAVLAIFLPVLAGLPPQFIGPLAAVGGAALAKGAIYVTVWTLYLNRSQRVKATYAM